MKLLQTLFISLFTLFFISCGETTTTSPIADVTSIAIDDTNISIYSTQLTKELTATATYSDGTTANATADLAWSSSDTSTLLTAVGQVLAAKNGGEANLTIDYANTFDNTVAVYIKELLDINVSDINVSATGEAQIVYFSGIFKNYDTNETGVPLENNIVWYSDANSTISDVNATQLTLTVDYNTTSVLLRPVLFGTDDFNKTFY